MPRSRVLSVLLVLFAAVIIALPLTFGLPGASTPASATDSGDAINEIYWVVFVLAAIVFIGVEATLIVFLFRFRRRRETPPDAEGPQIHGNTRVEVVWTVVPALLLLGLAIYTFSRVPDVEATPSSNEDVLVVDVTGHQFYWQYRYPNGALSFDVLYLPVDRKVTLRIRSEDVPHSWWVPQLTGKRDAIPGRTNELHFRPRERGTFDHGVCGEFCGIQHAHMTFRVEVLGAGAFERWLDENRQPDRVALGEQEWRASCAKCHGFQGEGDIGPAIAGNGTLTNAASLRRLLYEGQNLEANPGYMPPVGKGWTDGQIDALVAYAKSNEKLAGGASGG
ncbi:MAG: cytochrome c oxidase subunit II [Actinomycetota bacterium]|nr:cytochrome c oxidase subunit II [Actinomycetota bacterium]